MAYFSVNINIEQRLGEHLATYTQQKLLYDCSCPLSVEDQTGSRVFAQSEKF